MVKLTTEEFIQKAKAVHGDKYDYSLVEYINSRTKIKIICPIHGVYVQKANKHIYSKCGCQKCGGNLNLTTEEFIEKSRLIHGDKYNYGQVEYINNEIKVKIICPIHGSWESLPLGHIHKRHGCPGCSGNLKLTKDEFIKKAKEIHGNKYDYSKIIYINGREAVEIICPEHGSFFQEAASHINSTCNCPKCTGFNKNTEDIILEFKKVHGNIYDYSLVEYKGSSEKVSIICKKHNLVFEQKVGSHRYGSGCPVCKEVITVELNL